ncbi:MAG TPA: SGNH/GDSL hydrolase family protein, partial [Sulfitobacter sp.]|nr:SGNH/GDSL hydrolase family protein [Sulfitobacter sp.]
MREILAVLLIVTGLSACTDTAPRGGGDILVLGDSIMAWNGGRSIPDVIANQTGRSVTSRAVPGAQFDNGSTIASAVGFDIQQQFPGGRWNWVVVNGGANDLSADCGCGACGASVNALIAPDGQSGSIPAFLQRL